MARARVMSFMAGLQHRSPSDKADSTRSRDASRDRAPPPQSIPTAASSFSVNHKPPMPADPQQIVGGRQRASSRPMSMIGGYQAPMMPVASDTIPELAPIFTLMNSHANKLYQEGYFLKLNDLDTHGRPYADRLWTECFAQLVGTVLSLWDAAALDAAGDDGEVSPTFINLGDASIKMIESLPTRSGDTQPLTNVLSISTAGKNRYLLHFSTINALTQWTAGIRLAMYENACLQEAYTGSLIAGKGRGLNNIKTIMDKTRFKTEEWTRVRFGAGTPWRRCWCVISPPDEKEIVAHKKATKKRSAYDRSIPQLKGDIKFYDTRKVTKKTKPVATIREAYSAYAIYPQSKALVDQSTLIKIEGPITIHTNPESTTEGFVFVMPEVHPAVSGFEMMLRFVFPIFDVFILYGRPTRLIPDTREVKSLMFGMPQDRRTGYLEIFDVVTLINTSGSQGWSEREWKKQMKEMTLQRLNRLQGQSHRVSRDSGSRIGHRNSLPSRGGLRFQDNMMRSTPTLVQNTGAPPSSPPPPPPHAEATAPGDRQLPPTPQARVHMRSASDHATTSPRGQRETPGFISPRTSQEQFSSRMIPDDDEHSDFPPTPPKHELPLLPPVYPSNELYDSEDSERPYVDAFEGHHVADGHPQPLSPVIAPPAFSHQPGEVPATRPSDRPELRRANSRMSSATLSQLAAAGNFSNQAGRAPPMPTRDSHGSDDSETRVVNANVEHSGITADQGPTDQGLVMAGNSGPSRVIPESTLTANQSASPPRSPQHLPPSDGTQSLHAPPQPYLRSNSPLSQAISLSDAPNAKDHAAAAAAVAVKAPKPELSRQSLEGRPTTSGSTASDPRSAVRPTLTSQKSLVRKPLPNKSQPSSAFPQRVSSVYYNEALPLSADASPFNDNVDRYSTDSNEDVTHRGSISDVGASPNRDQPRSGVLRTVGTTASSQQDVTIGDTRYRADTANNQQSENWTIDFGPTHIYDPSVPSRTMLEERKSYGHSRQASTSSPDVSLLSSPEKVQSRSASEDRDGRRRSQMWQPGHALGSPSTDITGLTPEQFVQQRAAAPWPAAPYAHYRQSGMSPIVPRTGSATPPSRGSRNNSADWNAGGGSARPESRGRFAGGSVDFSTHLSAREQEHVSRMTGSPLVDLVNQASKDPIQGGLVGTIDAREREKRDMRNMQANIAVQNAIAAQQALNSGRTSQQSYASSHRLTPPMQQIPGYYPPTPQYYDGGWEENRAGSSLGHLPQQTTSQGAAPTAYRQFEDAPYYGSYRPGQSFQRASQ